MNKTPRRRSIRLDIGDTPVYYELETGNGNPGTWCVHRIDVPTGVKTGDQFVGLMWNKAIEQLAMMIVDDIRDELLA